MLYIFFLKQTIYATELSHALKTDIEDIKNIIEEQCFIHSPVLMKQRDQLIQPPGCATHLYPTLHLPSGSERNKRAESAMRAREIDRSRGARSFELGYLGFFFTRRYSHLFVSSPLQTRSHTFFFWGALWGRVEG